MYKILNYEIEELAQRVLRAYRRLPCFYGKTVFNTDPAILAEQLLHLSIHYDCLSTKKVLLGLTAFEETDVNLIVSEWQKKTIYLDGKTMYIEEALKKPGASRGRLNFTIGHEDSHHILKLAFPNMYAGCNVMAARCVYARGNKDRQPDEILADKLTAELLMPQDAIEYCLYTYGFHGKIRVAFERELLDKEKQLFIYMMNYLGVSKTALLKRLVDLGYTMEID